MKRKRTPLDDVPMADEKAISNSPTTQTRPSNPDVPPPSAVADDPTATKATQTPAREITSFADFGLDPRLLQAVAKLKYEAPTLVQKKAIPLALDGQDVLAKAKTGSGKTAAYLLPVLNGVLKRKGTDSTQSTAILVLVPTRELADQVTKNIEQLITFCTRDISVVKLSDNVSEAVQRSLLSLNPDIVVATPARAWRSASTGTGGTPAPLTLDKVSHLVLDEADLVLSYGYKDDLDNLLHVIPKGIQTIMTSATLTEEVDTLTSLFCRNPVRLDLYEPDAEGEGVTQYMIRCGEDEKFLLAYVIFKLKLIKGKAIFFVSDTDRCYRLKLFFEQFGIRSCVLNSELPVNSRLHVVEEFNRNVYDYIIASDEGEMLGNEDDGDVDEAVVTEPSGTAEQTTISNVANRKQQIKADHKQSNKKRRKAGQDKEYGVSRGVDFKNVAAVINFDLPTSAKSYAHRIGRTARASQNGIALSFVVPKDLYRKHVPTSIPSAEFDEKVLARIEKQQAKVGKEVKPYHFDMAQVEAFRYRMNDALRSVSRIAIREARTRELRQELLKSEKLKRHFEENPRELKHLRHDVESRTTRQQPHLKHVPDYMLPKEGKKALTTEDVGFVPLRKQQSNAGGKKFIKGRTKPGSGFRAGRKKVDVLKTFKTRRKGK